jgi:cysteine synthase
MVVEDGVDYMDEANRLAAENGWYDVDQYDNLANMKAHEESMAPELYTQTEGSITHFVAGGSTGGTVSGVGKGLKAVKPGVKIVLADPVGSVFAPMFETGELVEQGKFLVEGVGKGNIRKITTQRQYRAHREGGSEGGRGRTRRPAAGSSALVAAVTVLTCPCAGCVVLLDLICSW